MTEVQTMLVSLAATLAAAAGIAKFFHLGEITKGLLEVVRDWKGDPPRPGYDGRPGIPQRMENVEKRTAALNHDFRNDIGGRLQLLEVQLEEVVGTTTQLKRNGGSSVADKVHDVARLVGDLHEAASVNNKAIADLNSRLTDHRRRNEQQVDELKKALTQHVGDRERLDAYRATLHELGLIPPKTVGDRPDL